MPTLPDLPENRQEPNAAPGRNSPRSLPRNGSKIVWNCQRVNVRAGKIQPHHGEGPRDLLLVDGICLNAAESVEVFARFADHYRLTLIAPLFKRKDLVT